MSLAPFNIQVSHKMAYYVQHKNDRTYAPWWAEDHAHACRLLMEIITHNPNLAGHLEIVEV